MADTFAGVRGLRRPLVCPTFTLVGVLAPTTATVIAATTGTVTPPTTGEYDYAACKPCPLCRQKQTCMSDLPAKADV